MYCMGKSRVVNSINGKRRDTQTRVGLSDPVQRLLDSFDVLAPLAVGNVRERLIAAEGAILEPLTGRIVDTFSGKQF
jgi:hypothetical protein